MPPDSHRLDGPTRPLDPRTNAFRADLADIALAGRRFAPHYAQAAAARCVVPFATLHAVPDANSPAVSQLLAGEEFRLLDRSGGWAWGACAHDGYVGYLPDAALGAPEPASHRVVAPMALVFAGPGIKEAVVARWPLGSRLLGTATGDFLRTGAGYVHTRHVAPLAHCLPDWAGTAEQLAGQPYLWGGRGGGGIDCSGLVQQALALAGRAVPRDSDQQRHALGEELPADAALRRGDLLFFPGHVGIMVDEERMVHANAWWMAVTVEPLADVIARAAIAHPHPVLARRRLG